ncbi:family 43 glycosylhydrolase [Aeoliella mucimassa]|uniref:Alpha-galactosidase n=1 Tax=Aeoliella mucimassa TaxID=2527972 RepID=A0A518APG6_9BACT|nr:family 43 glycosylhydrolase [Aeoliella mucimassa]QDU56620.1 Alpha-galactosidase A precursor [Aeoliella mucimassa]
MVNFFHSPLRLLLVALSLLPCTLVKAEDFRDWATSPPMGWNSWDCFGTTVTEAQVRAQADAMAEYLKPAGYDVLTVDIQWYEPNALGHVYKPGARLEMDQYGRLLPAVRRFPSAKDGNGFKPLADYVHSKGLRFGIHIMRGIPRQAFKQNIPVLGTNVRAADIAVVESTCPWNPDMFGVDATTTNGQAYYDSLIQLYASWGVDFIKCDDISRPYDNVQKAEIEALRKAIDKCGRPIVLSLSPGATPVSAGPHVSTHANMWRITDDFWDRWGLLEAMFERTHAWEPFRQPGAWPDADMLPIGKVEFGRDTRFTKDEQHTMMSLWCIARSPLIFGGDMTQLDEFTLSMLTNPEVLKVNQQSANNRQLYRKDNLIAWVADVPDSDDKYLALFNAQDPGDSIDFSLADYASPAIAGNGSSQEISVSVKGGKQLVLFVNDAADGFEYDHAAWVDPILKGPQGELPLTKLQWTHADSGWGAPHVNRTCENQRLLVNGKPVRGIGTHSTSTIIYDLPEGYDTFSTTGVVTNKGSVVFGVLVVKSGQSVADVSSVSVELQHLGFTGNVQVRDLWKRESVGVCANTFAAELPQHGAGLYRLSPTQQSVSLTGPISYTSSTSAASDGEATAIDFHSAGNPILGDGQYYSADAAPLSVDDTLFIYGGHDEPPPTVGGFVMHDYGVFVTQNPTAGEWKLYPHNLVPGSVFDWATGNNAYAGQVARGPDGRFYWYAPVESRATNVPNRMAIGVAVSDSPLGPWTDAIGQPLVSWTTVFGDNKIGQEVIDPHVFCDDDGKVYLYWGSWGVARVVELHESMIELKGEITTMAGLDGFFEAPWVFKRDGTYYLAYDWKKGGSEWTPSNYQAAIGYATSSSPTGPWTFQHIILSGTSATTVHPSIVEHNDRWWITYHTRDAEAGGHFRRSVAIDEVHWQGDQMLPVEQTWANPPMLQLTNNLAIDATASASYTEQPPMTLRALNDGRPPVVRLPPDQWGNYRGNRSSNQSDWVQYDWDIPVAINGVGIEFHQDPNWIRPPASWKLEYQDTSGKWLEVEGVEYPTAPDHWHTLHFEPVIAKALRATFYGQPSGRYYHSVSVSEWEVYSQPAAELPTLKVRTQVGQPPELPESVPLTMPDGTELPTVVHWQKVPEDHYSAPGTFTVQGRAAGQAAGYLIATVECTAAAANHRN